MGFCAFCGAPTKGKNRACDSFECQKRLRSNWRTGITIVVPDGYLTTTQFAKRIGITPQMVVRHAKAGKYPDAFQDPRSGRWYIPDPSCAPPLNRPQVVDRRRPRRISATDREWREIIEKAALTKHSLNDYILRKALDLTIYMDKQYAE